MSYYKNNEGVVFYEAPEQPSAVYSPEEWVVEKERLTIGLQKQIDAIQSQIDNNPQPIEILEDYPDNVKEILQQHNNEIPSTESLETEKQNKMDLLTEITNI